MKDKKPTPKTPADAYADIFDPPPAPPPVPLSDERIREFVERAIVVKNGFINILCNNEHTARYIAKKCQERSTIDITMMTLVDYLRGGEDAPF